MNAFAGDHSATTATGEWTSLRLPVVLCGIGFGGFFDGIVFHQILQLHHMLSNTGDDRLGVERRPVDTVAGLEMNTLWDGLFHAFTFLVLLVGVIWLWRRWRTLPAAWPPWTELCGGLLLGWGLFNVIEGVIDHHLLAVHHVVEDGPVLLADLLFLAVGAGMVASGLALFAGSGDKR